MNKKSLVSVVVPVYNVENYVEECIKSIQEQTYEKLEIILVDDGSLDKSGEICEKLSRQDERIKVIHKENGGLSDARNVGVRGAKGNYVVFVDSDDLIHPQMIQILYEEMLRTNADITICSHKKIYDTRDLDFSFIKEKREVEILSGQECVEKIYSSLSVDMVVAWNKLYKKDYLLKFPYPIGKIHEDEFTTYKILMPLNRCLYMAYPLYFYRQRENSIMQQSFNLKELDCLDACYERKNYFKEMGAKDLYLTSLCRYQTVLAEMILKVQKYYPSEKKLIKELEKRFRNDWKKETKKAEIDWKYKLKYIVFMMNKNWYKNMKEIKRKTNPG